MCVDNRSLELGCPIRKFSDQSLFAAPQDLSQRTTSFIASQRQGIHRIPLRHLIALIINAHRHAFRFGAERSLGRVVQPERFRLRLPDIEVKDNEDASAEH